MESDWRLFREQDKYLLGVSLVKQSYESSNPFNDHDHCEFCMAKFGTGNDELKQGYSTEDSSIWICPQCYTDFKKQFKWTITSGKTGHGSKPLKKGQSGDGSVIDPENN